MGRDNPTHASEHAQLDHDQDRAEPRCTCARATPDTLCPFCVREQEYADKVRATAQATIDAERRARAGAFHPLHGVPVDTVRHTHAAQDSMRLLAEQDAQDGADAAEVSREFAADLARVLPLIGADATLERHRAVAERIAGEVGRHG